MEDILTLLQIKVDLLLGFLGALLVSNILLYKELRGGKWTPCMKIGVASSILIFAVAVVSTIQRFWD